MRLARREKLVQPVSVVTTAQRVTLDETAARENTETREKLALSVTKVALERTDHRDSKDKKATLVKPELQAHQEHRALSAKAAHQVVLDLTEKRAQQVNLVATELAVSRVVRETLALTEKLATKVKRAVKEKKELLVLQDNSVKWATKEMKAPRDLMDPREHVV